MILDRLKIYALQKRREIRPVCKQANKTGQMYTRLFFRAGAKIFKCRGETRFPAETTYFSRFGTLPYE